MGNFNNVRRAIEEKAGHDGKNGLLAEHANCNKRLMRWLERRTV